MQSICRALILCICSIGLSWTATAATLNVDCNAGDAIQSKLSEAKPGDVVRVQGVCKEGVQIASEMVRITLIGEGATIEAPKGRDGIFIRGRDITVRGFTITGGRDGIHLSGQAAGASAIIEKNTIREVGRRGIHLDQKSVARIGSNTIENIPSDGIELNESSVARIGFIIFEALPNTIRNVGGNAIVITARSTARILGNSLTGNKRNGVVVSDNSHAYLWANNVSGNGADGFHVGYGSGIIISGNRMPKHGGENSTSAAQLNGGYGLRCLGASYIVGSVAKLNGKRGSKSVDSSCLERAAAR